MATLSEHATKHARDIIGMTASACVGVDWDTRRKLAHALTIGLSGISESISFRDISDIVEEAADKSGNYYNAISFLDAALNGIKFKDGVWLS